MLGKMVEELGRMSINGFIAFFSSCYSFMVSKNHSKNGFSYMYSIPWFHNQTAPNLLLVLKKKRKKVHVKMGLIQRRRDSCQIQLWCGNVKRKHNRVSKIISDNWQFIETNFFKPLKRCQFWCVKRRI